MARLPLVLDSKTDGEMDAQFDRQSGDRAMQRRSIEPNGTRFTRFRWLYERPFFFISSAFVVALAIIAFQNWQFQTKLVETQALESARLVAETVAEVRTLYTKEVVNRARSIGVVVTHDYIETDGAIPLPATFSMLLGERLALRDTAKVRLYSPYPFPWRRDEGGLRGDFSKQAWAYLQENPDDEYYRFGIIDGRQVIRYAKADTLRPGCVACHNSHPDTPKDDWVVGDVRGILEIIAPIGLPFTEIQSVAVGPALTTVVVTLLDWEKSRNIS